MTNLNLIKNILYEVLNKEIDGRNVVLLDLPNYYNPGDQLIWEGEEKIISKLNAKVKYRSSLHFFNPKMVKDGDCILMQGGGNFGDLYVKHQKFREYIVKKFNKNKIIILPISVHFNKIENLLKNADSFNKHNDLVICARDTYSFKLLKKYYKSNMSYKVPDTAFSIENVNEENSHKINKILLLSRTDDEKGSYSDDIHRVINRNIDTLDWPCYNNGKIKLYLHIVFLYLNRFILKLYKVLGKHWNKKYDIYGIIKYHSKDKQINEAVNLLKKYDLIITTRLHGFILSVLLGIPTIMVNNSYGKNKNFYHTWMINYKNTFYADSVTDLNRILRNNFSYIQK